jgi:hypothetical protein
MNHQTIFTAQRTGLAAALALAVLIAGCGPKAPEPAPAAEAAAPAPPTADAAPTGEADAAEVEALLTLTPEGMEALLAPIALYPDAVLAHVLTAATNPQMVLDAGNWLIANPGLSGRALDEAAQPLGFSPSMRALLQFPEVVDMMCMQLEWTTQLGEAFVADQAGALDAVQRLRLQATEVGNLASSEQLAVATEAQDGRDVITVAPADPKVLYVPQYDPVAVYAPPPATLPVPTESLQADVKSGHSTASLVTTGLLSFGAGLLVAEIFDDDDDWYDYRPNWGYGGLYYGGRPYYPPPPGFYRPVYGNSFRPGYGYSRPPNYQHGFNNNIIYINNQGNDYWGGFGGRPGASGNRPGLPASPITSARPGRPDLQGPALQARPAKVAPGAAENRAGWQGQDRYAGAKGRTKEATAVAANRVNPGAYSRDASAEARAAAAANASRQRDRPTATIDRGRDDRPQMARPEARPAQRPEARPAQLPEARPAQRPEARPAQRPEARPAQRPEARPAQRPEARPAQRPEARPAQRPEARPAQRPEARPAQRPQARPAQRPEARPAPRPAVPRGGARNNRAGASPNSFGGPSRAGNDRAASARGRSSLPRGARSPGAAAQPSANQRPRR